MIKFQNVSKVYQENAVLSDVNLTIQQGEFFVLVGPVVVEKRLIGSLSQRRVKWLSMSKR